MERKISICGKGGSGKSTVVALLAAELLRRNRSVLVVDSDESNSGLYRMLGFERGPQPLLDLVGGKKKVLKAMRSSYSDGARSPAAVLKQERITVGEIPPDYVARQDGLSMVAVGKIHQALEGCACPMGVLSREFLKRLRLGAGEVALIDMEAGIEHFGRGVETSIDAVLAVVEPSLESIDLAAKIHELATQAGAQFAGAVLNKVQSPAVERRLRDELEARQLRVLGLVHYHQALADAGLAGLSLTEMDSMEDVVHLVDALGTFES